MNGNLIGWLAAGVALATGVGALAWYLKHREEEVKDGPTPSNPPRKAADDKDDDAPIQDKHEDATPDSQKDNPDKSLNRPGFDFLDRERLPAILVQAIDESFGEGWSVTEEAVDELEVDDVVVFAVKSQATGPYTRTVEEVVTAHVLAVQSESVRARVMGPVKHSEHLGNVAGHGLRTGTAVDVPRSVILVAAAEERGDGYGGQGEAVATFRPSSNTNKVYTVHPGTPYDLRLPYRTEELEWYIDPNTTKMEFIGDDGLLEQIVFSEDSPRGSVIVRLLDNDPNVGKVLVGRWEFKLAS